MHNISREGAADELVCIEVQEFLVNFEVRRAEKASHGSRGLVSVKNLSLGTQLWHFAVALFLW